MWIIGEHGSLYIIQSHVYDGRIYEINGII